MPPTMDLDDTGAPTVGYTITSMVGPFARDFAAAGYDAWMPHPFDATNAF
jgi:hypothetical protein